MNPKFKCPFCKKETAYESEAFLESVAINGLIRWGGNDWWLDLKNRFCSLEHLFAYIRQEMVE